MKIFPKVFLTGILLIAIASGFAHKATAQSVSLVKILQSRQYTLHSTALGRDMIVKVRFPDDYEKSDKKYPVLYLLDGDPFFAAATDIVHYLEWGNLMPQVIIVSPAYGFVHLAENGGTDFRTQDFSLVPNDAVKEAHPERFYHFLTDELIPFADKKFRTDPGDRCLWGFSASGSMGLFTLFQDGQPFNRIILLEGNYQPVVDFEKNYHNTHSDLPVKLFIGYGIQSPECRQVIDSLQKRSYKKLTLYSVQLKNVPHLSIPGEGFTLGLKTVYNKLLPFEILLPIYAEKGIAATVEKYQSMVNGPEKDNYNWDRSQLDQLGWAITERGNTDDAINIAKMNALMHPDDDEVYCTLGWAYQNKGDKQTSLDYFEKALKLNPKNTYALERLQRADKAVAFWGLVGSATTNGWDGPDIQFNEDKNKKGIWVLKNVRLSDGEIKYRFSNDWRINYGNGKNGKLISDGENIKVIAGTYNITLDLTDNTDPKNTISRLK